jgi:hypothetical protein
LFLQNSPKLFFFQLQRKVVAYIVAGQQVSSKIDAMLSSLVHLLGSLPANGSPDETVISAATGKNTKLVKATQTLFFPSPNAIFSFFFFFWFSDVFFVCG